MHRLLNCPHPWAYGKYNEEEHSEPQHPRRIDGVDPDLLGGIRIRQVYDRSLQRNWTTVSSLLAILLFYSSFIAYLKGMPDGGGLQVNNKWDSHMAYILKINMIRTVDVLLPCVWRASYFAVPKGDDLLRMIFDARPLNANMYPPPSPNAATIDTILEELWRLCQLPGVIRISISDVRHAFWQCPLNKDIQQFFVLDHRQRLFFLTVMAMGWSFSPVICQALMWCAIAEAICSMNFKLLSSLADRVLPPFLAFNSKSVTGRVFLLYDNLLVAMISDSDISTPFRKLLDGIRRISVAWNIRWKCVKPDCIVETCDCDRCISKKRKRDDSMEHITSNLVKKPHCCYAFQHAFELFSSPSFEFTYLGVLIHFDPESGLVWKHPEAFITKIRVLIDTIRQVPPTARHVARAAGYVLRDKTIRFTKLASCASLLRLTSRVGSLMKSKRMWDLPLLALNAHTFGGNFRSSDIGLIMSELEALLENPWHIFAPKTRKDNVVFAAADASTDDGMGYFTWFPFSRKDPFQPPKARSRNGRHIPKNTINADWDIYLLELLAIVILSEHLAASPEHHSADWFIACDNQAVQFTIRNSFSISPLVQELLDRIEIACTRAASSIHMVDIRSEHNVADSCSHNKPIEEHRKNVTLDTIRRAYLGLPQPLSSSVRIIRDAGKRSEEELWQHALADSDTCRDPDLGPLFGPQMGFYQR